MRKLTRTCILLALITPASVVCANDASVALVYKSVYYVQSSPAAPVLGANPFDANAQVIEDHAGSIVPSPAISPSISGGGTSLSFYDGTSYSLGNDTDVNSAVRHATLADLNAAAPAGTRTLSFVGTSGQRASWTLNVSAPSSLSAFPTAPHISNFPAIANFQASAGLTINWDSLGGSTSDRVIIAGVDLTTGHSFDSGLSLTSGPNGTTTTYSIPAADFVPLHQYALSVTYAKIASETIAFPSLIPAAYLMTSTTEFTLNATPAPGDANGDQSVNMDDYLALDSSYLHQSPAAAFPVSWEEGDFNGDGLFDAADYAIIDGASASESSGAPAALAAAPVPEPAGLLFLSFSSIMLLRCPRRESARRNRVLLMVACRCPF